MNTRTPDSRPFDVFCKVVDHHGDAGTAWRLCREIQQLTGKGDQIRLFIDDPATLMPLIGKKWEQDQVIRMDNGIEIIPWTGLPAWLENEPRGADAAIEMFGCDIPDPYLNHFGDRLRLIINLEYFTCESWAEGYHLLESRLDGGTTRKYFYMPGLTRGSGGIMSSSRPLVQPSEREAFRCSWLKEVGLDLKWARRSWMSAYTYQTDFAPLLDSLQINKAPWLLWVFGQANHEQIRPLLNGWTRQPDLDRYEGFIRGDCLVLLMPFLNQVRYDELLAAGDWALVRGEDSFAGGLLSGRPFLWQLYPQHEEIHRVKMEAFLDILERDWPDSPEKHLYGETMRRFNFPYHGTGIDWNELLSIGNESGLPWSDLVVFLRTSCNLTEKLLEFSSRFFQGDIT